MTQIRELAEHMAEFFSEDAARWPLTESHSLPGAPLRVAFRWFGSEVPGFGRELLGHMATILATEDADVEVVLAEATGVNGAPGVGYEIVLNAVGERYPGWFALPDG